MLGKGEGEGASDGAAGRAGYEDGFAGSRRHGGLVEGMRIEGCEEGPCGICILGGEGGLADWNFCSRRSAVRMQYRVCIDSI